MKIGIVGVGNIAKKAYLPTYAQLQGEHQLLFATRNQETKKEIQHQYGFSEVYTTVEELLAEAIEICFIHSATPSHYELVRQCLMAGVSVFVDKPLSERFEEVEELTALAEAQQCLLMIGFNRRFAPMVDRLKVIPDKNLLLIQKNRVAAAAPTEYMLYDLFLHVVDTAVYLLDEPIQRSFSKITEHQGLMQRAVLHLETASTTAVVAMDLMSGANTETYQVTSPQGTFYLNDLTDMEFVTAEERQLIRFGDWETTLHKRGFEQQVRYFLTAVEEQEPLLMRQQQVVKSHELCGEMLRQHIRRML